MHDDDFIPYTGPDLTPDAGRRAGERFETEMASRRSVRHFRDTPVPADMIARAVRVASRAPSGANQQPWTFVAVSDPDVKRRIRLAAEREERENYEGRFPERWLEDLRHLGTNAEKPYLEIVPWLIVVFRQTTAPDGSRHYYTSESVGLACGFLFAALHVQGLATLCHTPNPMRFLSEILERPAHEKPYMLIPVGYPSEDCRVPNISKKSLDEVLVVVGDH